MKKLWWAAAAGVVGLVALEEILAARRGDAEMRLALEKVGARKIYLPEPGVAWLDFEVPFVHEGQQQACLIDCRARVIPDGGRYAGGTLSTMVSNLLLPRDDGYFEGVVVKLKDTCPVLVRVEVRTSGDVLEYLKKIATI